MRKFPTPRKSDLIVLVFTFILLVLVYSFQSELAASANALRNWMIQVGWQYGYLGAFLVSILGNFTIIFPVPYSLTIFTLGGLGLNPFLLGMFSGLGASIGEFSAYFLGRGVSMLKLEKTYGERFKRIKKMVREYGFLSVLLFAATPLPDDLVMIPLGIINYNLLLALIASFLGKMILCTFLGYAGMLSWKGVSLYFESKPLGVTVSLVGIILASYLTVRVDWLKLIREYQKTVERMKKLTREV